MLIRYYDWRELYVKVGNANIWVAMLVKEK
jgi:hypothetical protein